jgi:RNA polymerase sigma factor (sigma-70 family)
VLDRVRERQRRSTRDGQWTEEQYGSAGGGEVADRRAGADVLLGEQGEAARLADAIASLPPAAGRAFRLHKIDGLSHAEVAAQLGISRSGVEKHIAVAMAHLVRRMRD